MKAIFESSLDGHRIEYIYHVCEYVEILDIQDVLVIGPYNFYEELQTRFVCSKDKKYHFFKPIEKDDLNSLSQKKKFRNGYATIKLLNKLQQSFGITEYFLLSLGFAFDVIPFVKTSFQMSGIKYHFNEDIVNPKLYSKNLRSKAKQILFSKCLSSDTLKKLYILNNTTLTASLSKNYSSSKIFTLKDPVLNLKQFFSATEATPSIKRIKFIHIGLLTERKGTNELIQAVKDIPYSYHDKFEIIIAGMAKISYFKQLQQTSKYIREQTGFNNITLINKFLSNLEMHNYLKSADFVILPYKFTEMSSGIVGHSINYNIPLIVPDSGFYKQLLNHYQIGFAMSPGSDGIVNAIMDAIDNGYNYNKKDAEKFLDLNSPEAFSSTIINSFSN